MIISIKGIREQTSNLFQQMAHNVELTGEPWNMQKSGQARKGVCEATHKKIVPQVKR